MSKNSLIETGLISEVLSDSNQIRNYNQLVRKRTLTDLVEMARFAKWLSVRLPTKLLWVGIPLW